MELNVNVIHSFIVRRIPGWKHATETFFMTFIVKELGAIAHHNQRGVQSLQPRRQEIPKHCQQNRERNPEKIRRVHILSHHQEGPTETWLIFHPMKNGLQIMPKGACKQRVQLVWEKAAKSHPSTFDYLADQDPC